MSEEIISRIDRIAHQQRIYVKLSLVLVAVSLGGMALISAALLIRYDQLQSRYAVTEKELRELPARFSEQVNRSNSAISQVLSSVNAKLETLANPLQSPRPEPEGLRDARTKKRQ